MFTALKTIKRQLIKLGAKRIILFGSLNNDDIDIYSDLDLFVIMPPNKTGKEWMDFIYTNLEREIATICRGVAVHVAQEKVETVTIKKQDIFKYLGPVRISTEARSRVSTPGVAMGLAWTAAGGTLLFIEATAMKGKKALTLTGQLGDVMKESATAALSFIRTHAKRLEVDEDFFEKHDIHIHVPAGATPKDGPSAGVTMLTAMVSMMTNKPIRKNLAMTGEITLRGKVRPVGGIKEKVLAAHRSGIKTIIMPAWNKKDMEDIPEKVQNDIEFVFVEKMMDVLKIAFDQ